MSLSYHTLILKNDGTLWGSGFNNLGQLGLGDTNDRYTFTQITTNVDNIKSVYCSYRHTFILKNNGTLWGSGNNSSGQLGLGDRFNSETFTQITINTNDIKSIYCGYHYTIILKNDGTLWGCGKNEYGQLGLGDTTNRKTFTQITNDVKLAYCGGYHTFILKNDNTLWGCGWNESGQLGLGDTTNRNVFTQITANVDNIKSIYCGYNHTIILKNDNTLWGCGYNVYGQLGLGDNTNRTTLTEVFINVDDIKSVYCGNYHTIILKNNGTLWGCGYNSYGQLGLEDTDSRNTFTIIGINTNNIKSVYSSTDHTLILKNDGTLWGCGDNSYGELGLGDTTDRKTFTQITTNVDDVKCFANDYYSNTPSKIKIYDTKIGYAETLDTNNFRNIPVDNFKRLKALYTKPESTNINCIISFDKKQTWKSFDGNNWVEINNSSPDNIVLNCMSVSMLNFLDKNKLISGGFAGDLDFKIAMKTNNVNKTPSVTKIYIEYK